MELTAKPAFLAVTVFACGILACGECDGGFEADAKFGRLASPAIAAGREQRKTHRAVSRALSHPRLAYARQWSASCPPTESLP
jgi:hypothetical protein